MPHYKLKEYSDSIRSTVYEASPNKYFIVSIVFENQRNERCDCQNGKRRDDRNHENIHVLKNGRKGTYFYALCKDFSAGKMTRAARRAARCRYAENCMYQ